MKLPELTEKNQKHSFLYKQKKIIEIVKKNIFVN